MKYKPGSFSKNFAWHGTGLLKLHTAIKAGYHNKLAPVDRQIFRSDCGVVGGIELIPVNFFLHNEGGRMSVDELVFQAIKRPHSIRFDRLGLFAFHLNRAGRGRDRKSGHPIESRPAMWANEFVRDQLWSEGVWRARALADVSLDGFIRSRMAAQSAKLKCRNNYRHMFELCDYWPSPLRIINSGAEQWIASALFLAWDRHILDNGAADKSTLVQLVEKDELYKLLGVEKEYALTQAEAFTKVYAAAGKLDRLKGRAAFAVPAVELPEESGMEWLDQEEIDEVVERRTVERMEQKRDHKKAAALKKHYENVCMFCHARLQVSEDSFYSEAAHIKPLGKPHNGPDKVSNMLVLCPNHHLQFDRGVLRLQKKGNHYWIVSKTLNDPLNGIVMTRLHNLDNACVDWHYEWFRSERA